MTTELDSIIAGVEPRMRSQSEAWWSEPWGPGKWRRSQVLGHLIDSAANNHLRFVRALTGPSLEAPGYDQEACVEAQNYAALPPDLLVTMFASYNRLLAHVVKQIPAGKLATPCRVGGSDATTLEALVNGYAAHLQHHLRQISA